MIDREQLLEELIEIGLALTSERDLYALLDRILEAARRFTRAEAGTLFLCEGEHLRFAVVQNDLLERKGSGYVGKHGTDLLRSGDPWFRALNLKYGPDGGVYISGADTGRF